MVFQLSRHNSVINDYEEQGTMMLSKLAWLEYLEFFCRVAHIKFVSTEMEGLSLAEKIKFLMKDVFQLCLGVQMESVTEGDFESESDTDY